MPFKGQGQIQFKSLEGDVTNVILSNYEDNQLIITKLQPAITKFRHIIL